MSADILIERLRSPLPVCPFSPKSPDYLSDKFDGKPCPVCGGTEDGPDKCRGADTRCMEEAATRIEALERERDDAKLQWEMTQQNFGRMKQACREYHDRAEAAEASNRAMAEAVRLAVAMLGPNEPPDSRAVSDEFVALAAVSVGDTSEAVMAVIRAALASLPKQADQ